MFKLKGHSGCKLELHESKGVPAFVRKLSKDRSYDKRLYAQALKQASFKQSQTIFSPKILDLKFDDLNHYFDMEYIGGDDFITFTCGCRRASLNAISEAIFSFIDDNIKNSNWIEFPLEEYTKKVDDTLHLVRKEKKLSDSLCDDIGRFLLGGDFSQPFLSGYCHGDLTFSNMIVSEYDLRIALIDFLDQGFESPIHDIVKLRQDTKYYWTLNLYSSTVDSTKVKIAWAHIDSMLRDRFFENQSIAHYYSRMQVLNFLRILKYTQNEKMNTFVKDCLIDAMGEV